MTFEQVKLFKENSWQGEEIVGALEHIVNVWKIYDDANFFQAITGNTDIGFPMTSCQIPSTNILSSFEECNSFHYANNCFESCHVCHITQSVNNSSHIYYKV